MLKQAETGTLVGEVCRKAGIADATFYNWRKRDVGLMPSEVNPVTASQPRASLLRFTSKQDRRGDMPTAECPLVKAGRTPPTRLPERKPGAAQGAELMRIWDALDVDGRKLVLFVARQTAREKGLVAANTPLVITERVF